MEVTVRAEDPDFAVVAHVVQVKHYVQEEMDKAQAMGRALRA